ncbi:MAG: hypothetical protein KDD99_32755 [Bacteroidetes bacterium]|nr:hypothetical protein [Bacteroidota bacterium]
MRIIYSLAIGLIIFSSCGKDTETHSSPKQPAPIIGTWKLLTGTIIQGNDTTITDYMANQEFIKIINESHFAFFNHDLNMGKDSTAVFVAGGGKYSLEGNTYTEYLEYCNFREWENHEFEFEIKIIQDTLVIQGVEKVEELNVNRLNIEKYIRLSSLK